MKKEVTDIQELHVELDAEDQELMQMFPPRQRVLDDMLMVTEGEDCYLISKTWLARRKKLMQDAFDVATTGTAILVLLVQTILMVKRLANPLRCMPAMAAVMFCAMVLRLAVKHFRKEEHHDSH